MILNIAHPFDRNNYTKATMIKPVLSNSLTSLKMKRKSDMILMNVCYEHHSIILTLCNLTGPCSERPLEPSLYSLGGIFRVIQ